MARTVINVSSLLTLVGFLLFCLVFISNKTAIAIGMNVMNQQDTNKIEPIVLVHGGAGDIPDSRNDGKNKGTQLAARTGYKILENDGTVIDAVEAAVRSMELDDMFNAGYGSVLNLDGFIEMEASIMNGSDLKAGCITLLQDIMHPISVARRVMDKTRHVCLGGNGAMKFAKAEGFEILDPPGQLVTDYAREALEEFKQQLANGVDVTNAKTEIGDRTPVDITKRHPGEVGTVGAVAIDRNGNIAVATSTGGMTGKLVGRIGDTPILGSGTYADNEMGGVSTTGHGETILRFNLAQRILMKIANAKVSAQVATKQVLDEMTGRLNQTAGAITIDRAGDVGIYFTSQKMAWAYQKGTKLHYGILPNEDLVIDLN